MRIIGGRECFSSTEAILFLGVQTSTFYDLIKSRKIQSISLPSGSFVEKSVLKTFKDNYFNPISIEITKEDIKNDIWFSKTENIIKLKEWKMRKYVNWANMNLEDYIRYWRYVVKPIWISSPEYKSNQKKNTYQKPPNRWIIANVSKGFVESFNKKYLFDEHINTLNDFFEYLINKNLW